MLDGIPEALMLLGIRKPEKTKRKTTVQRKKGRMVYTWNPWNILYLYSHLYMQNSCVHQTSIKNWLFGVPGISYVKIIYLQSNYLSLGDYRCVISWDDSNITIFWGVNVNPENSCVFCFKHIKCSRGTWRLKGFGADGCGWWPNLDIHRIEVMVWMILACVMIWLNPLATLTELTKLLSPTLLLRVSLHK